MRNLLGPALLLGVLVLVAGSQASHGDDLDSLSTDPTHSSREIATKPLPGLDCYRCRGPRPCAPCRPAGGFLYYGTNPWDDDPLHRLDTCPGGHCGHVATSLSLHWIRLQEARPRLFHPSHASKPDQDACESR